MATCELGVEAERDRKPATMGTSAGMPSVSRISVGSKVPAVKAD